MMTRLQNVSVSLIVLLVTTLAAVYLLTYSAAIESGDALQYADAVSSVARYGDWRLDESLWHKPPLSFSADEAYPLSSLGVSDVLSVQLALPLYIAADRLGLGFIHTIWLFNVIVTALTAGLVFASARRMGATPAAALLTALAFGLGTVAWPYSKTYFRDPLAMLMLMAALWLLLVARERGGMARLLGWGGAAVVFWLATQAKTSALFALPGLLVLALPPLAFLNRRRVQAGLLVALLLVLAGLMLVVYVDSFFLIVNNLIQTILPSLDTTFSREALHSYLFSVGGSLWGTSPILLLGTYGIWQLYRQRQMIIVWSVLLIVMSYAVGHAFFTSSHWFGGLSWPPRFLLPTVPLVAVLCWPAFARLLRRPYPWLLAAVTLALIIYSLWIQFTAVAVPWLRYPDLLPPEAEGLIWWSPGMNDLTYLRWRLLVGEWGPLGFDFAWYRADLPLWALALSLIAGAGLVAAIAGLQARGRRWLHVGAVALPTILIVISYLGLTALAERDPLFLPDKSALHEALDVVAQEAAPGDVVLLTDPLYYRFIMNYARWDNARPIILPVQPGEAASERQPAEVDWHDPVDGLTHDTVLTLNALLETRDHFWLLAHNGPFTPWARRPVEAYLARWGYIVRDVPLPSADPTVRLLEINAARPPDPYAFTDADIPTDLRFDTVLRLLGVMLPHGLTYQPGDQIPVSIMWQTDAPLAQDIIVSVFLAAPDGYVTAQAQDRPPQAGFAPTTSWRPGVPVWDGHVVRIPAEAAPGTYQLWVVAYTLTNGDVQRLSVTAGVSAQEGKAGVLPVEIQVERIAD